MLDLPSRHLRVNAAHGKAPAIEVELEPSRDCRSLAAQWTALEARADCSFFLSWLWIGSWLAELPEEVNPLCLRARLDGETVGLALLTWRHVRRRGVIRSRQLHLHATGHPYFDLLTVEYNDFLVDRRVATETRQAMADALASWTDLWDELFLEGSMPHVSELLEDMPGGSTVHRGVHPLVDLAAIDGADCLAALGRNTRHQIRRTQRLCGEPTLEQAATPAQCDEFFDGLAEQHQAIWTARNAAGAFWNDFLRGFHRRVIAGGMPTGQVQLLRTRAGDGAIMGHLYNFVYRGRVYSYQSGFAPYDDNRVKPGLLSHHLAIVLNRGKGQRYYDFLAGDMRYKRSLSNRQGEMIWVRVQRPSLLFAAERRLRAAKRRIEGWIGRGGR